MSRETLTFDPTVYRGGHGTGHSRFRNFLAVFACFPTDLCCAVGRRELQDLSSFPTGSARIARHVSPSIALRAAGVFVW